MIGRFEKTEDCAGRIWSPSPAVERSGSLAESERSMCRRYPFTCMPEIVAEEFRLEEIPDLQLR